MTPQEWQTKTVQHLRWGIVRQPLQSTWQEKHQERNTTPHVDATLWDVATGKIKPKSSPIISNLVVKLKCNYIMEKQSHQIDSNTVYRTKLRIQISSNLGSHGSPWFTTHKEQCCAFCGRMSAATPQRGKTSRNATARRGKT